jgi:CBS domain-containing protein
MKIEDLMSTSLVTCHPRDNLSRAAQMMWEHDCGAVPVVDDQARVVGMLTDRDICMAAYTQGLPLAQIRVSSVCSRIVQACDVNDTIEGAENLMRRAQIRRLPIVDRNGRLLGVLSLGDLAQHVHTNGRESDGLSCESVARTLAAVSRPRSPVDERGGWVRREREVRTTASA